MFAVLAVFIFLFLIRTADADVTLDDLPGQYNVVGQGLQSCGKALKVKSSGRTISSLNFGGGDQCTFIGTTFGQRRSESNSSDSTSLGTFLMSSIFTCPQANPVTLALFKPAKYVNSAVPGFAEPYEFRPGIKYAMLSGTTNKWACIYQQDGASSTDADSGEGNNGQDSDEVSKGTGEGRGSNGGGDSGIWVWLGPVIGAVATVIAALITVYCVRSPNPPGENIDVR